MLRRGLASFLLPHTAKKRSLLFAGQDHFSPRASVTALRLAPLETWLGALGFIDDQDVQVTHLATGLAHSLIAYRTKEGIERVLSLGRNDCGQLGIGYTSAESTRGHVEGFDGSRIAQLAAGNASSYLLIDQFDSRRLYVFGSRMRGQLGLPALLEPKPAARSMHMSSFATPVPLPEHLEPLSVTSGFEHALLLCKDKKTGESKVLATGANPDGQLGLDHQRDIEEFKPIDVLNVVAVSAGADTSAVLTNGGALLTFGNNEYGQCLQGHINDAILRPLAVELDRKVRDVSFGGSFAVLLDQARQVCTAGFGALGLGSQHLEELKPTLLPSLEGSNVIRAAHNYAAAIKDGQVYVWGIAQGHTGRLGFGVNLERLYEPTHLPLPAGLEDAQVVDVQLGGQNLWLIVEEEA